MANQNDYQLRLDDLQYKGLSLWQYSSLYCFTSDAVLLANLAKVKKGDVVADFGTGSGIIAVLVAAKTGAAKIYASPSTATTAACIRNAPYCGIRQQIAR